MTSQSDRSHEADTSAGHSFAEAARLLGLDCFTVHGMFQRGSLRVERAAWGEYRVPQSELDRVLRTPRSRADNGTNQEAVC